MRGHNAPGPPRHAAREAAGWISAEWRRAHHTACRPRVGIVLGSGLNDLLTDAADAQPFAYRDIPYFAPTTVSGHLGRLDLGTVCGQSVAILRGRFHFYEGHSPAQVTLPIRTLHALGVETLIVTNAAGGLNPQYRQGDLMLMRDHIGLPTLGGWNPLIGPNDDDLGPRFPPMAAAYDPDLIALTHRLAAREHLRLHEGVYIMVSGPTYETPAEMRALRILGADAVGMSTVPEVIAARHVGMKVLGISCITNTATPETASAVSHEAVLLGAAAIQPTLDWLLHAVLHATAPPPAVQLQPDAEQMDYAAPPTPIQHPHAARPF